jgi:uncharacterized NAD(P)/FAD-binding protein YdhS
LLLARAESGDLPLQAILLSMRKYTHKIWLLLSDIERRRFQKHHLREWDLWRYAMPTSTAHVVLQAIKERRVEIKKIDKAIGSSDGISITSQDGKCRNYKTVIDGTGGHSNVARSPDPFLQELIEKQLVMPSEFGGLAIDNYSLHALAIRYTTNKIFPLGQIVKGDLFSTNALWFNRECGDKIAANISQQGPKRQTA